MTHTRSSLLSRTTPTPSMFTVLMSRAPSYLRLVDHCPLACGATTLDCGSESMMSQLQTIRAEHKIDLHKTFTRCMLVPLYWHVGTVTLAFKCHDTGVSEL